MRQQNSNISAIVVSVFVLSFACLPTVTTAQSSKPNIVVILGDDIGYWNVSAYNHGLMSWTPNIDSIAKNGILFTDHYDQPSSTAGRALEGKQADPAFSRTPDAERSYVIKVTRPDLLQ